ncbi:glutathione S-transferase family protein [Rhizobium sp. EC-SD404]|uniref:glutathione S-transferase family protein n=1 Tax=Rhizobium sp. EC-SD404 TaxID=2038389 RepID=UPI001257022D|nr:glutathione S-transferase family protein [Rhizobium sp. EC-SD404]VVT16110.1 Glutathione S-transferase domain-containing protein [Rhizobium sp. EC-SD404]
MTIQLYELVGSDTARPFSPHCWKVVMALAHKGLERESQYVPFTEIPQIEDGSGIVPLIRDGNATVSDSFAIALHLESAWPDRPSLFGGKGGEAMARFVEAWSQTQVHAIVGKAAIMDVHDALAPDDQAFFRKSREARFGMPLEETRERGLSELGQLNARLEPMRAMLRHQPFIGGASPLFSDYILFGAFQWARIIMREPLLSHDDPVLDWFETCLDLHDGIGRSVPAAA